MLALSKISSLTWFTVQLYEASPGGGRWQGGERGAIETLLLASVPDAAAVN